jgi:hypothetical protein
MALAADQNSSGRADIVVISAPGESDVTFDRNEPIRGIGFHTTRTS